MGNENQGSMLDPESRKRLESNVSKIVALGAVSGAMSLPIPTIVIFWQDHGLSLRDVFTLEAIFAAAFAVAKVPCGYAADLAGRRAALLASSVLLLAGIGVYNAGYGFAAFVAAEILIGVGFALLFGTEQALLEDSLVALGRAGEFQRAWGKACAVTKVVCSGMALFGGLLAAVDVRLPFKGALVVAALMLPVVWGLAEPPRPKLAAGGHLRNLARIGRLCLFENERVRWMIVFSGVVTAAVQVGFWSYQPYWRSLGVEIGYFGTIIAAYGIVAAAASWLARRAGSSLERAVFGAIVALLAVSFFATGSVTALAGVLIGAGHQVVRGFGDVIFAAYINREISGDVRATVISVQKMAGALIYAPFLLAAGWGIEHLGFSEMLILGSAGILVVGGMLVALSPRASR